MPRDLPLGNGRLLVNFDLNYCLRDLYFPYVGQENHGGGRQSRFGVWVEGRFTWIGPEWRKELLYEEDTLVSQVSLYQPELQLLIRCRDAVDFHEPILVREVVLENLLDRERQVRLFFHLDLNISGNEVGDTAAFDPESGGVVHYKGARYFLVNGMVAQGGGIAQFAVGQKGLATREGTFRDAEDGVLSGNPIAQGAVDSVSGLHLVVPPLGRSRAYFWLSVGQSWQEVRRLDNLVRYQQPDRLLTRTAAYWRLWVRKETPPLELLPPELGALYRRSLLLLATQIDSHGGILAGTDSDVIAFNRDTYAYIWPRDGALAAYALALSGYPQPARNFFAFVGPLLDPGGYFLHKYNPDGTLASSWHPWFADGQNQLPIQEDSTALVIWALWQYFVLYREVEFIKPLYRPLIKRAADFMSQYRDQETGLPGPSYDLWEERRGISAFTVGAVFGGLTAASLFCTIFGETDRARLYQNAAAEIRDAASAYLWRSEWGRFCRLLFRSPAGELEADPCIDASLWGLFAFGLYAPNDPRLTATMDYLRQRLWVNKPVAGLARYENDPYYQVDPQLPGNPWVICTLWLADYLIQHATSEEDLAQAVAIIRTVAAQAQPSGVLPEQYHPHTGAPLSVSPLTWSHATFLATSHSLLRRLAAARTCPTCGAAPLFYLQRADWLEKLYGATCDAIHGSCRL